MLDKRKVCDLALQELVNTEIVTPCEEMFDQDGWCKEHCKPEYPGPQTECWRRYLERKAEK